MIDFLVCVQFLLIVLKAILQQCFKTFLRKCTRIEIHLLTPQGLQVHLLFQRALVMSLFQTLQNVQLLGLRVGTFNMLSDFLFCRLYWMFLYLGESLLWNCSVPM